MKNILKLTTIIELSISTVCAAALSQAQQLYNANQFEQAYVAFTPLVRAEPTNPELIFYLGRSALETKRYNEALAAFERVLMLNPNHTRSHLEIARIYFELGQLELANAQLEQVLAASLPNNVREVVLAFKANVDSARTKHRFDGFVTTGFGYDTNVNNDIGKKNFFVHFYDQRLLLEGNEKRSDSFTFGLVGINHRYDMGDIGGWSMEQSGTFYTKLHRHTTENNIAYFALSTAPTYREGRYSIGIPISFDKVYLSGEGYMHTPSIGLRGTYLFDPTLRVDGEYAFRRSYYSKNDTYDTKGHFVLGSLRKIFTPDDPIVVALRLGYSKEDAVHSGRTDVNSYNLRYGIDISKELGFDIHGTLSYSHTMTNYRDKDALLLSKRKDKRDDFGAKLSYPLYKNVTVGLSVNYINNKSNHAPYDYDKVTAITHISWGF